MIYNQIFIFCFIWSAGANFDDVSRKKFNNEIHNYFRRGIYDGFPYEGEIYDYYVDFETKEFERWSKKLTNFVYDDKVPFFNILVPTEDTVKFKEILKILMRGGFNTLING